MEQALKNYIVAPTDIEMCRIWGALRAERKAAGRPISPQDAWIAATALRHKLPLVTNNGKDFQGIADFDVRTATP
jgi:tRNA(fMet)-specific endonuclease VapC